jgi:hypothetical protein
MRTEVVVSADGTTIAHRPSGSEPQFSSPAYRDRDQRTKARIGPARFCEPG